MLTATQEKISVHFQWIEYWSTGNCPNDMKIFVAAGETSGDLHASNLVMEIKREIPGAEFWGIGMDRMEGAGVQLVRNMKKMDIVGLDGIWKKLPDFIKLTKRIISRAKGDGTKLAIFVDYPGYNIYLAKHFKSLGIKTVYFIAPQVWGWWSFRAKWIKRYFDHVFVIYPFEEEFFKKYAVQAKYVGNPVIEMIMKEKQNCNITLPQGKKILGLLPGSRYGEVKRILPRMVKVKEVLERGHKDLHFLLSLIPENIEISEKGNLTVIRGKGRDVMRCSDAILAASGTATLEAALMLKPLVVVYELSALSYIIGKMVQRVEYLSLANIVASNRVVEEFIQEIPEQRVADILEAYLYDRKSKIEAIKRLENVKAKLVGGAYKNTANLIKTEVLNEDD